MVRITPFIASVFLTMVAAQGQPWAPGAGAPVPSGTGAPVPYGSGYPSNGGPPAPPGGKPVGGYGRKPAGYAGEAFDIAEPLGSFHPAQRRQDSYGGQPQGGPGYGNQPGFQTYTRGSEGPQQTGYSSPGQGQGPSGQPGPNPDQGSGYGQGQGHSHQGSDSSQSYGHH